MKRLTLFAVAVLALRPASCGHNVSIPARSAPSVPAARGVVHLGHDKNGNTRVEFKVKHLAKPERLTPSKTAYVVWVQPSPQGPPENKGTLTVNDNLSGEFKGVTPYKSFDIFVTAEDNPQATAPSSEEVLRATVQG